MQPEQPQAPQAPQMPAAPAPQPEPQPTPPAAPQPTQPAAPAPSGPHYQQVCWYIPEGSLTIFSAKSSVLSVYPGWLIITRKSDNAELKRIQLTPDLHLKYFFNFTRISHVGGQKIGVFKRGYNFLIGSPIGYGIFLLSALARLIIDANELAGGVRTGTGALVGSGGLIIALILMALDIPKVKAFIAACKQAAGVAH